MGIGSTVKNMLGGDAGPAEHDVNIDDSNFMSDAAGADDPNRLHLTNSNRAARLPSGTGPGTSGKGTGSGSGAKGSTFARTSDARPLDPDSTVQRDLERSRGGDISGYGSDAAAAAGGSLSTSHQVSDRRGSNASTRQGAGGASSVDRSGNTRDLFTSATASGPTPVDSSKRASQVARDNINKMKGQTITSNLEPTQNLTSVSESSEIDRYGNEDVRVIHEREVNEREYDVPIQGTQGALTQAGNDHVRRSENLSENHQVGHTKPSSKDSMPTPNAEEDTHQLQPVTHEKIRHLETEEVSRVMELDRHIHHVQYHTQPVIASEELAEQIREKIIPVTTINEIHTNKAEDNTLFEGQVHQYHDTLTHAAKERTVIDKGTTVRERVHHHVHHVIQPVIEKETIDKQVIRTTIPIHEISHEAPVVHQSQTHAPVPLEHFLSRGGTIRGAISQDAISKKVLRTGSCSREVDGVAETLERDLRLKDIGPQGRNRKVIETDEQIRTTVVPVGQN